MAMHLKTRQDYRERRHRRVRRKVSGTAERPRMAIFKSNRLMSIQFVDDVRGVTLASATLDTETEKKNIKGAQALGQRAAAAALAKGLRNVVVDRGGFRFHGRLKALVEAAVTAGLVIQASPPGSAAPAAPDKEDK